MIVVLIWDGAVHVSAYDYMHTDGKVAISLVTHTHSFANRFSNSLQITGKIPYHTVYGTRV